MNHLGHVAYGDNYNRDLETLVGSPIVGTYEVNAYVTPYHTVKTTEDGRAIKIVHASMRDEVYEFVSPLAYHRHKMGMTTPQYIEKLG